MGDGMPTYERPPQCRAIALTLHAPNCCVLPWAHGGRHKNSLGMEFTGSVTSAFHLHDAIAAMCPCQKHRRYRAVRKPRTACEGCWRLYILTHPSISIETRWMSR